MTINLDTLRKIAENEPSHKWGKWTAEEDDWEGFVVFANDGLPGQSVVANGIRQGHDEGKATATHIATFDPPTVLALITELETFRRRLDAMRRQRDGYQNQLRKAEQQVARVQELREGQLCGHCADEVQDALEGELE
ncbi:hypothetical protein [Glutamicibacter arilaitensis]|uniref:hypothetical protein n=1 Tax=Glutamicibacter arilaitensis TaxID=256701 RepID=UPI003FD10DD4